MVLKMFASFRGYVFASLLLTTAVVSHAVYLKRFFYRSVVYLSKSKFAMLAVGNMALVSVLLLWRLIQAIFLGPLRFREVERLHIRARDAVIECCFAISVFRGDFDETFVALVMTLLLLKSLHWLSKDRIEFLEEQPLSPVRTHLRLVGLMSVLLFIDVLLVKRFAYITLTSEKATMYVLFAFEYTIMVIELVSDIVRYSFLVIDTSMDGHWEEKGMFSFYIELLSDLCQLTVYVLFFIYVQVFYSFPLHIIRELYITFTKFQRRCSDFLRYRHVVATMNDLFADATEEELNEGDRTCIICREEMQTAKKLACGHIFHARCLQSWLKRQLSCPTCRATIDVHGNTESARNGRNPARRDQVNNNNVQNNNAVGDAADANARPDQGAANVGDAGVRLLNLANQWWNQWMVEANAAQGVRPVLPAGGVNAAGVAGAGDAGRPNNANAQTLENAGRANAQLRQNEIPQNNDNPANVLLRGPNAVAHMQLRARRRGAWPHPYQPYQVHQLANYGYHAPRQGHGAIGPHPTQDGQAPLSDTQRRASTGNPNETGRTNDENGVPLQQSMRTLGGPVRDGAQHAHATESGRKSHSTASAAGDPAPQETGNAASRSEQHLPASNAGGAQSSNSGTSASEHTRTDPTSVSGIDRRSDHLRPRGVAPSVPDRQSIPLAKLLAIQEQIEVLRGEVLDLILIATSGPSTPSVSQRSPDAMGPSPIEGGHEPDAAQSDNGSESIAASRNVASASGAESQDVKEEDGGDSESERLRRRRIEFLERTTNNS